MAGSTPGIVLHGKRIHPGSPRDREPRVINTSIRLPRSKARDVLRIVSNFFRRVDRDRVPSVTLDTLAEVEARGFRAAKITPASLAASRRSVLRTAREENLRGRERHIDFLRSMVAKHLEAEDYKSARDILNEIHALDPTNWHTTADLVRIVFVMARSEFWRTGSLRRLRRVVSLCEEARRNLPEYNRRMARLGSEVTEAEITELATIEKRARTLLALHEQGLVSDGAVKGKLEGVLAYHFSEEIPLRHDTYLEVVDGLHEAGVALDTIALVFSCFQPNEPTSKHDALGGKRPVPFRHIAAVNWLSQHYRLEQILQSFERAESLCGGRTHLDRQRDTLAALYFHFAADEVLEEKGFAGLHEAEGLITSSREILSAEVAKDLAKDIRRGMARVRSRDRSSRQRRLGSDAQQVFAESVADLMERPEAVTELVERARILVNEAYDPARPGYQAKERSLLYMLVFEFVEDRETAMAALVIADELCRQDPVLAREITKAIGRLMRGHKVVFKPIGRGRERALEIDRDIFEKMIRAGHLAVGSAARDVSEESMAEFLANGDFSAVAPQTERPFEVLETAFDFLCVRMGETGEVRGAFERVIEQPFVRPTSLRSHYLTVLGVRAERTETRIGLLEAAVREDERNVLAWIELARESLNNDNLTRCQEAQTAALKQRDDEVVRLRLAPIEMEAAAVKMEQMIAEGEGVVGDREKARVRFENTWKPQFVEARKAHPDRTYLAEDWAGVVEGLAQIYLAQGRAEQAKRLVLREGAGQILGGNSAVAADLYGFGIRGLLGINGNKDALEIVDRCLELQPENPHLLGLRRRLLVMLGRKVEAVATTPVDVEARKVGTRTGYFLVRKPSGEPGEMPSVEATLEGYDPGQELETCLRRLIGFGHLTAALAMFEERAGQVTESAEFLDDLLFETGAGRLISQRTNEAQQAMYDEREVDSDDARLWNLVVRLSRAGLMTAKDVITRRPMLFEAFKRLCQVTGEDLDVDEAVLRDVVELDPEHFIGFEALSKLLMDTKRNNEARELLERAISTEAARTIGEQVLARSNLMEIARRMAFASGDSRAEHAKVLSSGMSVVNAAQVVALVEEEADAAAAKEVLGATYNLHQALARGYLAVIFSFKPNMRAEMERHYSDAISLAEGNVTILSRLYTYVCQTEALDYGREVLAAISRMDPDHVEPGERRIYVDAVNKLAVRARTRLVEIKDELEVKRSRLAKIAEERRAVVQGEIEALVVERDEIVAENMGLLERALPLGPLHPDAALEYGYYYILAERFGEAFAHLMHLINVLESPGGITEEQRFAYHLAYLNGAYASCKQAEAEQEGTVRWSALKERAARMYKKAAGIALGYDLKVGTVQNAMVGYAQELIELGELEKAEEACNLSLDMADEEGVKGHEGLFDTLVTIRLKQGRARGAIGALRQLHGFKPGSTSILECLLEIEEDGEATWAAARSFLDGVDRKSGFLMPVVFERWLDKKRKKAIDVPPKLNAFLDSVMREQEEKVPVLAGLDNGLISSASTGILGRLPTISAAGSGDAGLADAMAKLRDVREAADELDANKAKARKLREKGKKKKLRVRPRPKRKT
ncbi:tetratricopeptide repeat protein [Candidatus Margulisiibacteriota bacterium]